MWGLGWLGQAGLRHPEALGRRNPRGASRCQAGLGDLLVDSSQEGLPDLPQDCRLSRPAACGPCPPIPSGLPDTQSHKDRGCHQRPGTVPKTGDTIRCHVEPSLRPSPGMTVKSGILQLFGVDRASWLLTTDGSPARLWGQGDPLSLVFPGRTGVSSQGPVLWAWPSPQANWDGW